MRNILVIFTLLFSISAFAQVDTNLIEIKKYSIDSKNLETERNYWICLPINYDSTLRYPVMYVLDAEWRFSITNSLEKELSSYGKIPAHIVVGITHPSRRLDMSFSTSKVKYTGEADTISFNSRNSGDGLKFFKFIEEELMTEVNRNFSTSGLNVLIGHSLGGYYCSYILPYQKSFKSLQIYDPSIWYSEGEAIQQIENNTSKKSDCIVFISSSSNFENQFSYHHKKIKQLTKSINRYKNIKYEYKSYKDESHNSMYLHSFLDGMSMLYDGYELKMGGLDTKISVSKVEQHFKQFSNTIKFKITPPNDLYLTVGYTNYFQKKYINCVDALNIYLAKNPENSYALQLIGDAYYVLGEREKSLNYYSKSYAIAPDKSLKEKIDNFKK